MGNVATDLGKRKCHIVVEHDGAIVRRGYPETTADGLREYLSDVSNPSFIVEAISMLDRVANYLVQYSEASPLPTWQRSGQLHNR